MSDDRSRRAAPPATGGPGGPVAACRRLRALRHCLRGYLHEDYAAEHGDAEGAMRAFCRDATPAEVCAVRDEWQTFSQLTKGWDIGAVASLLTRELGSSWVPASGRQLAAVARILDAACQRTS